MGNTLSSDSSLDSISDDNSKTGKSLLFIAGQNKRCSLCLGIPETGIFQCNIGHHTCSTCSKKTEGCLVCKNNEVKGDLIQNHLSKKLFVPCRFSDQGCKFTTKKILLGEHENKCIYRGTMLPLCRYLEYNCDYPSNCLRVQEIVSHFKTHDAIIHSGSFVDLHFVELSSSVAKCFETLENGKFGHWRPVILTNSDGDSFLILSRLFWLNKIKMFVLTCVQLNKPETENNCEVKVCIQTIQENVRLIEWMETCHTFATMKCVQAWSAFRICLVDELEALYTDHEGTMKVRLCFKRIDNVVKNTTADTMETAGDHHGNLVVLHDLRSSVTE